jgi:hypothetical protein
MFATMLYNIKLQEYTIVSHNLTSDEALIEVKNLRSDKQPAFLFYHAEEHINDDAEQCYECGKRIEEITNKPKE